MAGLNEPSVSRGQFVAVARLQWRAFINASLRTTRGRLELLSRLVMSVFFAGLGLGGAVGLGTSAWYLVHRGRAGYLAVLLWPVFAFWQVFPLIATAFTERFDSSHLLRFPLSFRAYLLLRLASGVFEPVTAVGGLWLFGIVIGTGIARPALLPWTVLVLLVFAAFNVVLTRMFFAWTERWLAQRRTREILGVLGILLILSIQFLGPLLDRYHKAAPSHTGHLAIEIGQVQAVLPPGLAAGAVAAASRGEAATAVAAAAGLCAFLAVTAWLLGLRLRSEYRGEDLSESAAKTNPHVTLPTEQRSWPSWGLPSSIAAVVEKDIRSLVRSPPLLFILLMPLILLLLLFLVSPESARGAAGVAFLTHRPDLAFPAGTAYALVVLTSLSHNFLGGEGTGVQLLFALPVTFRKIALGKNLAFATIVVLQVFSIWLAACILYKPPEPAVTLATLTGVLFVLPVEFAVGNLLSVYSPKRIDYSAFGRQSASRMTVLAGLAVHAVLFGLAAFIAFLAQLYAGLWMAVPAFLVLAIPSVALYLFVLGRLDRIALGRREALIAELSRTD